MSAEQGKREAEARAEAGPVMLALSTFRHSDAAAKAAIDRAAETGARLVIVFIADVNLARYFIGADVGICGDMKRTCETELLREHEDRGREKVDDIAMMAGEKGLQVSSYVCVGRFALECLDIVKREKPALIVTTRSHRPDWVKKFFGSPVDHLIAEAGCPVLEA